MVETVWTQWAWESPVRLCRVPARSRHCIYDRHTQPITRTDTTFAARPQKDSAGTDVKHRKRKHAAVSSTEAHISITIYRAMSWLLTFYTPFYTNSWQQWLGLAFFSDFVFIAPWKLPTVKNKVLRLCCYAYYRGILLPPFLAECWGAPSPIFRLNSHHR